jgi:tripeptide aminopeptidase
MKISRIVSAVPLTLALWSAAPAPSGEQTVSRVLSDSKFRAAAAFVEADHERIVQETIRLTEIAAPPFKEERRGKAYMAMLKQHGLVDVEQDAEGNVMGVRRGTGRGPMLAVAAHLDTVFPEGTDVTVKREGTVLKAPGVGDDTRSLAVLLGVVRALNSAQVETASDILFIGNVGEEGQGDLRGMRYLFGSGKYKDRIKSFISVDGAGTGRITNGALGSKRYRVSFRGPGGHSYGAFGIVSPSFALGQAIDRFSRVSVSSNPKTTFNVGVIGGGTSVNSIPYSVWMEVDMRSESPDELNRVENEFLKIVRDAAEAENRARSTAQGSIVPEAKLIGDRPSGQTQVTAPLVQMAAAVMRSQGVEPRFEISSTDANIPISLGIPAITIGSGGRGGRGHALDEWIDVEKTASVRGITGVMAVIVSAAGMATDPGSASSGR